MNFLFPVSISSDTPLETRLMRVSAVFLFLYSIALTLAPAARSHSWLVEYRWHHWFGFVIWLVCFAWLYRVVRRHLPNHDPYLLPIISLLVGWGLLTIWRLSGFFGLRQTVWLILGSVTVYLIIRFPKWLDFFRRYKYLSLLLGLLLVALTFFIGKYPQGTGPELWLGSHGIYFQPSEPLKLFIILFLSAYLSEQLFVSLNFRQLVVPTAVLMTTALLILFGQRDMGTALLVLLIYTLVVYLSIGKRRVLAFAAIALIGLGVLGYYYSSTINARILSWLNPWADPAGSSYQIVQSLIAAAAGGIFGTGPGLGSPGLVPLAHSDFISAAILEETGLIGFASLLFLFALFFIRALYNGLLAKSNYKRFLATSIGVYIAVQSLLIVGGNLRVLPLTGITLPFVSYGGSSLVITMAAAGILILVSDQRTDVIFELPRLRPYRILGALVSIAFFAMLLVAGWYGVVRSESLVNRDDNIRWTINARFIPRGSILDRSNQIIAETVGVPGSFERQVRYPPLSNTIGYANLLYGKSGLESSLDRYLTGTLGPDPLQIEYDKLLYSQPPNGLNVRLSLDLDLQKVADQALGKHIGAVVVLNSESGEILAITSSPSFDTNHMEEKMAEWKNDRTSPLLNRVMQGQYPLGTLWNPFLFAQGTKTITPASSETVNVDGFIFTCTIAPQGKDIQSAIAAGCPATLLKQASNLTSSELTALAKNLGFTVEPFSGTEIVAPDQPAPKFDTQSLLYSKSQLLVSPLQVALATAQVSTNGVRPSPRLAAAVEIPVKGWTVLPSSPVTTSAAKLNISQDLQLNGNDNLPVWEALGSAETAEPRKITWYIASTKSTWQGSPVTVAVVVEEDNPALAMRVGRLVMNASISTVGSGN